jgi:hypothetical protein
MSDETKNNILFPSVVGMITLLFGIMVGSILDTTLEDSIDSIETRITIIDKRIETQFTDINGELTRLTGYQNRNFDRLNDMDDDVDDLQHRVSVVESTIEIRGL